MEAREGVQFPGTGVADSHELSLGIEYRSSGRTQDFSASAISPVPSVFYLSSLLTGYQVYAEVGSVLDEILLYIYIFNFFCLRMLSLKVLRHFIASRYIFLSEQLKYVYF